MSQEEEKTPGRLSRFFSYLRTSGRLKDLRLFLIFVGVAALFWFIMAMNDQGQADFQVKVEITDVPDSVTFITDPPRSIAINVRNKGTSLLRHRFMDSPVIRLSFKEFAEKNQLEVSTAAIMTRLRAIFGTSATINITSVDHISAQYTTLPGKLVPVKVIYDVTPTLGRVVNGNPKLSTREVEIYSVGGQQDTIMYVTTEPIVKRDVSDPLTVKVALKPIKGVKMVPPEVTVTIPVEPLENRKVYVPVTPMNVPAGESMALFPQKVEVSYLVPMSQSDNVVGESFTVTADYADKDTSNVARVRVRLTGAPKGVENATLLQDSVEYTIIRTLP